MPVYNGEDFLEDQLNSILNQTYQDFKLLFMMIYQLIIQD